MIYDCFTFFNELDMLEIRFNVLNDIVDKFVLVESIKTFRGKDKPLFYNENKDRFKKFNDKIIHIIVDDFPLFPELSATAQNWANENFQRNKIANGLIDCKDDDVIMISDVDEIPDPQRVLEVKDLPGIKALDMNCFHCYLNRLAFELRWSHSTKILSYYDFKHILDDSDHDFIASPKIVNDGTTPNRIRLYYGDRQVHFPNSGWHFSWLGDLGHVKKKAEAICDGNGSMTLKDAEKWKNGDTYRYWKFISIKIDQSFPKYIVDNIDKFQSFIVPDATRMARDVIAESWASIANHPKVVKKLLVKARLISLFIPNKKLRHKIRSYYVSDGIWGC